MRVLVTGATGLVGKAVCRRLAERGDSVVILSRDAERAKRTVGIACEAFTWDPMTGPPPPESLARLDAVIHLLGENVAEGRWNAAKKAAIRDSRVVGTRHLVEALSKRKGPPLTLVSASAIGFYGDRGDEELHEVSAAGTGFLADVCKDWEREARALPYGAGRVVIVRVGIVLSREGGVLERLLPIFRMGGGGPIGSGKHWMSWIHIDDLVALLLSGVDNPALEGVVNGVSPAPVTNNDFSKALGHALGRPSVLRAPVFALKLMLGEMAEVALSSQRVIPDKALAAGFRYRFPTLQDALADLVRSERAAPARPPEATA